MLAKLTFLQKEEVALKDIESKLTEQLTRLQQEELHLRSLQRESEDRQPLSAPSSSSVAYSGQPTQQVVSIILPDNVTVSSIETQPDTIIASTSSETLSVSQAVINTTPLIDLTLQPKTLPSMTAATHVEEEEEEEEGEDKHVPPERQCDAMGYNSDLLALMQQIEGDSSSEASQTQDGDG